jgi:excisionase family DNA binding protein
MCENPRESSTNGLHKQILNGDRMRGLDRDWQFEGTGHQDDDDWSDGRPSREQLLNFGETSSLGNRTLLVTVEEAARLLGIGRTTMFELIGSGDVKSVRLGRRRLIARKSLESFVDDLASS